VSANAVPQLLASAARELVARIETSGACVISRVIGDLLVELTQHGRSGERYELGHEYLVSDFPLTADVLRTREPRIVALADEDADAAESELLRRLGFESLLMLVLTLHGQTWALVELYGGACAFGDDDVAVASEIVRTVERRLEAS
jgi:hypothetical protein